MKSKLSLKGRGLQLLAQREHSRLELRRKLMRHALVECKARDAEAIGATEATYVTELTEVTEVEVPPRSLSSRAGGLATGRSATPAPRHEAEDGLMPTRDTAHDGGGDSGEVSELSGEFPSGRALRLRGAATKLRLARSISVRAAEPAAGTRLPNASRSHVPGGSRRAGQGEPPAPTADTSSPAELVEAVLDWLQVRGYLSEARFAESRVHARASRFGNQRIRQELAQHGVTLAPADLQSLKDSELARARAVWSRKFGHHPADAAERGRQMRFLAGRGFSSEVVRRVVQGGDDD